MKTSKTGRAVLMAREGVRLKAYRDTQGVLTIGVGHTGRASAPSVQAGMTITSAQADEILATDLVVFEKAVNAALTVPVTQNQFDACISLAYNVGGSGFARSTVVRQINAGQIEAAADAFLLWNKPAEIRTRRAAEREQFLTAYEVSMPRARSSDSPLAMQEVVPVLATPTPLVRTGFLAWFRGLLKKA